MYEKVTSEGIVLRKHGAGEANLRVAILSREFGLVVASARSARKEASKLRYGLEPLTFARFCFVRGMHEWRVAEVQRIQPLPSPRAGRAAQLLLRLVHGEGKNLQLFDSVSEGFLLLSKGDSLALEACRASSEDALDSIETVLVLRILAHLGYLPHTEALAPFIEGGFSISLAAQALERRTLLVKVINESLQATGL